MSTRFCLQKPRLGLTDRVDYLVKAQKAYVQPTTLKMKAHTHKQHQDVIHIGSVEMHRV